MRPRASLTVSSISGSIRRMFLIMNSAVSMRRKRLWASPSMKMNSPDAPSRVGGIGLRTGNPGRYWSELKPGWRSSCRTSSCLVISQAQPPKGSLILPVDSSRCFRS